MIEHAKEYLQKGWAPIPLKPRDKRPLIKDWSRFSDTLPDEGLVEEWWKRYPNANLGIVTGPASGLLVIDVDAGHGGWDSIKGCDMPKTMRAITGSGGGHLYYRYPINNGKIGNRTRILPGVDIRGYGGQVVAPPSIHPNGKKYQWRDQEAQIADPPEWLMELLIEQKSLGISIPQYKTNVPEGPIADGQRNNTLTSIGGAMRRQGISEDAIAAALLKENAAKCNPPLPESEVLAIAHSVARYEPEKRDPVVTVIPPEMKGAELFPLELPDSVWRGVVLDYRNMLAKTTEASDAYHLFTFLAGAGSVLGRKAYIDYGLPLYANLYVCLVGRTGQDRKSTSLRHSENIMRDVDSAWRVLRGLSSAEGLLAQIADPWKKENAKGDVVAQGGTEDKRLMVWLGELSSLLRKAKQDKVANIIPLLTEAYDCPPDLHLPTKSDPIVSTEPFISLVCASTPSWLEDLQDRDVLGGFANRFAFILGPAKDPIPFPDPPDVQLKQKISSHLVDVMAWLPDRFEVTLTDDARQIWAEFYTRWHSTHWPDELLSAIVQRIPDMVLKVALIYAVLEKRHQIDTEILNAAIEVGGYAAASVQRIFSDFHTTRESKLEKRILEVLGVGVMKFGDLHRAVGGRYSTLELNRALDALCKSGQIWRREEGRTVAFGLSENE